MKRDLNFIFKINNRDWEGGGGSALIHVYAYVFIYFLLFNRNRKRLFPLERGWKSFFQTRMQHPDVSRDIFEDVKGID